MHPQRNPTTLASSSVDTGASSASNGDHAANTTAASFYSFQSEEDFHEAKRKWEEEFRKQELKDLEWIFGLAAENSGGNETPDALCDGEVGGSFHPCFSTL